MILNTYFTPGEAAEKLTERAGRTITVDDLRQMRRHKRIEGIPISVNLTGYTPEQVDAATIPPERQPKKKRRKSRKKQYSASTKTDTLTT